ncbi:DNA primase [Prochlorococcus sp. MIT 1223]|uniref:DNA primase n=1 Tax=Prochlorococcus sp. MIT 1223 TaxID=3096217 RepID=UPI002A751E19|nr:DNA primase [Prochlorococcus sp. MIT 1223]
MTSPRFHPRTIEAVKERADIVDIVGEHVVLKKRGREFVGICPFHDDSKPSMTVSPAKQFYYCFSCGAGGNSIKFLMEFQRQSFSEVVLELARRYQLPIETFDAPQQERFRKQLSRKESLLRVLSLAAGWYQCQLKSSGGHNAYEYLINQRSLSDGTLDNFMLGYAPDQWDGLLNYLHQVENISLELLESSGLIVPRKGGNGFYDRFRNRVIVPIFDQQNRVIGFGGRSLDGSEPKYLNSPETEIFEKGKHLYGLDKAAKTIRTEDLAVVVEGYFDVIALHQAGISNAVASLGTALSNQQITKLSRCTESKRICLNFDSDSAGIRAANRAITEVEQLSMQGQLELRVLHLPEGKDPDEFLKQHSSADYKALLDKSPLWLDWQIDNVIKDLDLNKSDHFQLAVSGVVQLLGKLPNSALRTHYLQKVSELLSGGHSRFAIQLEKDLRNQIKGQRWHGRSRKFDQPGEAPLREKSEAEILRIYIHFPIHRGEIRKEMRAREIEDFAFHHHRLLWVAISELEEEKVGPDLLESVNRGDSSGDELFAINLNDLVFDKLINEDSKTLSKITQLLTPGEFQLTAMSQPTHLFRGAMATLERQKSIKRCRHLIESWSSQRLRTLEECITSLIENNRLDTSESVEIEDKINLMFNQLNNDAINFQELYYSERKHILYLDKQRCLNDNNSNFNE